MLLCLHAIVKDESLTITRLLDSVRDIVDEYVIVDTGSTDETCTIIRDYPHLKGVVLNEPFVDFGTTRTRALELARWHTQAAYFLLLDADMILECNDPALFRQEIAGADVCTIVQVMGDLSYRNVRVIRTHLDCRYVGVTHEYLEHGANANAIAVATARINDRGDGGCKANKFERDERLLEQSLRHNPSDLRATFYLAETLFNLGKYRRAIEVYKQRIIGGGWAAEVAYAHYKIVCGLLALDMWVEARAWEEDHRHVNMVNTADSCAVLCRYHRERGRHVEAYKYYLLGKQQRVPEDVLFLHRAVYDYLLDYEATILLYYVAKDGLEHCWRLLHRTDLPEWMRRNVMDNMTFYLSPIKGAMRPIPPPPGLLEGGWTPSTPSFVPGYGVIVRAVNYRIETDGSYTWTGEFVRNSQFGPNGEIAVDMPPHAIENPRFLGLEDLRVWQSSNKQHCFLAACAEFGPLVRQVYGTLCKDRLVVSCVFDKAEEHEKNWVWIGNGEIVYRWWPTIRLAKMDTVNGLLTDERDVPVPACFQDMRGSTNACFYSSEWWFVTHSVVLTHGGARKYLHYIVVLDQDVTRVTRTSMPFVFSGHASVEYCLGLEVNDEGISFGFSVSDSETWVKQMKWKDLLLYACETNGKAVG